MSSRTMRWLLVTGLAVIGVVFIAILFGSFSMLNRQSQKLVDLKLQNHVADTQLVHLPDVKKQVATYGFFNDVAKTVLPADKDQAQAVSDIYQMASDSGIAIQELTFPASSLGGTTSSASNTSAKTVISQATPVSGINGLYSIPLTISPQTGASVPADKKVTYDKFLTFMKHIENNRRTAQITKIDVTPTSTGDFNFVITVNLFIKP